MGTTNLLAEILIIGTWAAFWAIPIFREAVTVDCITYVSKLNFEKIAALAAIVYFLGMIMNFVSDVVFSPLDKLLAKRFGGKDALIKSRAYLIIKSDKAYEYLMQRRSFVRIYRANTLNCILIFLVTAFDIGNISFAYSISRIRLCFSVIVVAIICLTAYLKTLSGYFAYIDQTMSEIERDKNE
jgi:hypothetical protein